MKFWPVFSGERFRASGPCCLDSSQLNILMNAAEIIESINHLHANKSPGTDGICMEMYKCFIDIILPFLMKMLNEFFQSGEFPD